MSTCTRSAPHSDPHTGGHVAAAHAAFVAIVNRGLLVTRREAVSFLVQTLVQPVFFLLVFGKVLTGIGVATCRLLGAVAARYRGLYGVRDPIAVGRHRPRSGPGLHWGDRRPTAGATPHLSRGRGEDSARHVAHAVRGGARCTRIRNSAGQEQNENTSVGSTYFGSRVSLPLSHERRPGLADTPDRLHVRHRLTSRTP